MWVYQYETHLIMSRYQSQYITSQTFIPSEIKQNSILNKHCPVKPRQYYICVGNKMTNNGPMWVPHGLNFQFRTLIGPIWALCPDSAHMGVI